MKNCKKYLFLVFFVFSFNIYGQAIDPSILSQLSPEQIEMVKEAYASKNSTDDSVECMKTEFPDIRLIVNKENFGFAGGYNEAIKKIDTEILVLLNSDVKVEKEYAKDLRTQVKEKKDKEFIQSKISEAKWLTKAIEKRNDTMIKVGSEIVKRQKLFLEKGAQYIKPMVLKDIAEAVGMHESTISRVTTGSLIQTPQGTLELKAFFSVGLLQDNDDGATSATSIKFKIKKLIEPEKPSNPVSDDAIVEILAKEGIVLARRTVAKYRKMENVPSSFARKRRNVIAGAI